MKKFLAMLLAVMLVIGLLPMSVLADFAFDFEAETVETPQLDHQDSEGTQPVSEGSSASSAGLPQKSAGLSAVQAQNEGEKTGETPKGKLVFDTKDFVADGETHIVYVKDQVTLTASVNQWYNTEGVLDNLPEGTKVTFKWKRETGRETSGAGLDTNDRTTTWTNMSFYSSTEGAEKYYYIEATASINGETYVTNSEKWKYIVRMAPVSVTLTVNNKGVLAKTKDGEAVVNLKVDNVFDLNGDDKLTVDEAMVAAHKQYMSETDYVSGNSGSYFTVSKLWGETSSNVLLFVNGVDNATSVDKTYLASKDSIWLSMVKSLSLTHCLG